MKRVYVATAYGNWAEARLAGEMLQADGMRSTSSWIVAADRNNGRELDTIGSVQAAHRQNYIDLRESDAVLVIRREGGGEMFVEFITAVQWEIPVVWVGRPILSARFHEGHSVTFAESLNDAIGKLKGPCLSG